MLKQDVYQPKYQFDVEVKFANIMIKEFPSLSPETVRVISKAIVNKLCEGVSYPDEMEEMIKVVFPLIIKNI